MTLPNHVYDILKWVVILVIPAVAVFYKDMATIWGWSFADEIPKTLYAIEILLGSIIGISTVGYENKKKDNLETIKALNHQEDKNED